MSDLIHLIRVYDAQHNHAIILRDFLLERLAR